MQPPFIHNGFLADVRFVSIEKRKKKFEHDSGRQDKKSLNGATLQDNKTIIIQQDQGVPEYLRPARVIEEVTRPRQLLESVTRPLQLLQPVTRPNQMFEIVTRSNQMFENKNRLSQQFQPVTRPRNLFNSVSNPSHPLHSVTTPTHILQSVTRPIQLIKSVTRPVQLLQSVTRAIQLGQLVAGPNKTSELPAKMFQCRDEVTDPHRSGLIQSSPVPGSNETCSLVFRGEQRDLVMLMITTLHLR